MCGEGHSPVGDDDRRSSGELVLPLLRRLAPECSGGRRQVEVTAEHLMQAHAVDMLGAPHLDEVSRGRELRGLELSHPKVYPDGQLQRRSAAEHLGNGPLGPVPGYFPRRYLGCSLP